MGTRNLICVIQGNEFKVSKYNQWDGYPEGVGADICEWITDEYDSDRFKAGLKNCYEIDEDALKQLWVDAGMEPDNTDGFVDMSVSEKFAKSNPQLGRDMSTPILDLIMHSDGPLPFKNDLDFANDSLFCEWLYVLNIDTETLEVYTGFNRTEVTEGRFTGPVNDDGYAPVRLVAEFDFYDLPEKADFVAICEERELPAELTEEAVETVLQDLRNLPFDAPAMEYIVPFIEERIEELMQYIRDGEAEK